MFKPKKENPQGSAQENSQGSAQKNEIEQGGAK
jgi:hypothetical protein